ncbi:MAG: tyrosine-type recombinase/integrase [Verrucomicrobiota bacterium]
MAKARLLLGDEIKNAALTDWRQAATLTIEKLVEMHAQNPMGLASSTLKIRVQLLDVFKRTWPYGFGMKASDVKPIMLKSWLAERKQRQELKAAGVNNYVRMLHGLFQIAVETGAVVESPARSLKTAKQETPDRLTPTWEQAHSIISATKTQISRDMLSAMLLLGLGQAELENLYGEHFDFERGQITVRRQKTQKVFIIPMYPQATSLLERFRNEGRIVVGKPLFDRVRPREALWMACTRLGYPLFTARSFRRAFIIRALEKGIDPRCVASWQGHRDATLVLRVYGHVIQGALQSSNGAAACISHPYGVGGCF